MAVDAGHKKTGKAQMEPVKSYDSSPHSDKLLHRSVRFSECAGSTVGLSRRKEAKDSWRILGEHLIWRHEGGQFRKSEVDNSFTASYRGGIVNLKFYRTAIIINNGLFSPFTGRVSVGLVFQCQFILFLLVDHFYHLSKDWKSRISCTFAHEFVFFWFAI